MRTKSRTEKIESVLAKRQPDLSVVLEDVHDPHNVSAVMRTCDSVGVYEVNLVYITEKFPEIGKISSAGTKKWIKYNKYTSRIDAVNTLKSQGFKIYASTLLEESIDLYDIDLTEKTALVFGNEHSGVSDELISLSDATFKIPMYGMAQSLNISVAAAVSLYEALRQRKIKGFYNSPRFHNEQLNKLIASWLEK